MEDSRYRRIVVEKRGGPEVMKVVEDHLPEPGESEVRVRTTAAGVSGMDLMVRAHSFPGFPKVPFTPGVDVVGVVDELGPEVLDLEPGTRVAALIGDTGGYSEAVCLPADKAVPLPDGLAPAEAAAVVTNYLTAYAMLHRAAQVKNGERILIHGATGGVGTALLELGTMDGLEMYGTASARNHDLVASFGATPIDYRHEDFVARIRELTGDGVDVVFDPIGGARQLWRSHKALAKGGRLVWFGVAGTAYRGVKVIPESLITRLIIALMPNGKQAPMPPAADKPTDWYRQTLEMLFDYAAAGKISPVIARRFPLLEARAAHEFMEQHQYAGKIVLVDGG
ncbi:MAG: zinc-binding dehydrogenase [Acidimicrobiia bacterium]|jgi:NADPH:quinone reductase-like Zn-dependent oxidoreductase